MLFRGAKRSEITLFPRIMNEGRKAHNICKAKEVMTGVIFFFLSLLLCASTDERRAHA